MMPDVPPSAAPPGAAAATAPSPAPSSRPDERVVVPELEERVDVGREAVETGRVRVRKVVRESERLVEVPLRHEEVRVERVPMNVPVRDPRRPPGPRYEDGGRTLVVPLLEEVLVVERRLVVREELRITRARGRRRHRQTVTLRREEAQVDRLPPAGAGG